MKNIIEIDQNNSWSLRFFIVIICFITILIGVFIAIELSLIIPLIMGVIGFVLLITLSFRYENLLFYLFILCLPLETVIKTSGLPNPIFMILGGMAVIAWFLQMFISRRKFIFDKSTIIVILLLVWSVVSALATGGFAALMTTRPYFLVTILYILTQNTLRKTEQFIQFGWVLSVSLAIVGAYILFGQASAFIDSGGSMSAQKLHAYANTQLAGINDSAIWSMRISKGIPYAIYLSMPLFTKSKFGKVLLLLCAGFMTLGPFSTITINGSIAVAASYGLIVLLSRDRRQKIRYIVLAILVLVLILFSPLMDRIYSQVETIQSSDPLKWGTSRGLTWYTGVQIIRKAPLFGLGPAEANILEASLEYISIEIREQRRRYSRDGVQPHNVFLTIGSSLGIPGLLLSVLFIVIILISLLIELRWLRRTEYDLKLMYMGQAVIIGIVTILIQSMVISIHLDNYFWLILGTAPAFIQITRKLRFREVSANQERLANF